MGVVDWTSIGGKSIHHVDADREFYFLRRPVFLRRSSTLSHSRKSTDSSRRLRAQYFSGFPGIEISGHGAGFVGVRIGGSASSNIGSERMLGLLTSDWTSLVPLLKVGAVSCATIAEQTKMSAEAPASRFPLPAPFHAV